MMKKRELGRSGLMVGDIGLGCTPAQFCLAWMLHRKPWIVPIPGTTKVSRVVENCGGADITLTKEDMDLFDKATEGLSFSL